jgi:nucleotide-binding universal stress UspA family protein
MDASIPSSSARSRLVLVVGIDLTEVSEHLLAKAHDLVHSVDEAELHVVHVVHPEPLRDRLVEPIGSGGMVERAHVESAHWEIAHLCNRIVHGSNARWIMHTPVGRPAEELTRVAREVGADFIVVEVHEHDHRRRLLHRSVAARIAENAPCSVLAIRDRTRVAPTVPGPVPATTPAAQPTTVTH